MPGDPNQCRLHAANCRELAARATSDAAREAFLKLAETWEQLAGELDGAQLFLRAMDEIEPKGAP
jgi:hypothetical protein